MLGASLHVLAPRTHAHGLAGGSVLAACMLHPFSYPLCFWTPVLQNLQTSNMNLTVENKSLAQQLDMAGRERASLQRDVLHLKEVGALACGEAPAKGSGATVLLCFLQ